MPQEMSRMASKSSSSPSRVRLVWVAVALLAASAFMYVGIIVKTALHGS
jgi:hypothetical protein